MKRSALAEFEALGDSSANDSTPADSFGTNGRVTTDMGATDSACAVAIQPDGKIVVAGTKYSSGRNVFAVARYTSAGALDTSSFGNSSGKAIVDFGGDNPLVGMAIQPDGKIVLAGSKDNSGTADFAVARLNADGSPDTHFAPGGMLTTDLSGGTDYAGGLAMQSDGRFVVAGYTGPFNGSPNATALARYPFVTAYSEFAGPRVVLEGQTNTWTLSSSRNVSSWTVDWGDGSPVQTYTTNPATISHNFQVDSAQIIITSTDDYGTHTQSVSVTTTSTNPILLTTDPVYRSESDLAWLDSSGSTSSYTVEQATDPNGTWTTIASPAAGSNSYVATGTFLRNTRYFFRVSTLDQNSNRVYSNVANVTFAPLNLSNLSDQSLRVGDVAFVSVPFTDFASSHSAVIDWGDGSTSTWTNCSSTDPDMSLWEDKGSGSVSGSHIYSAAGTHRVVITLTADDNVSATTSADMSVTNAAPVLTTVSAQVVQEGDAAEFNIPFSSADPNDTHTATVNWGDGSGAEAAEVHKIDGGGTILAAHTYSHNGVFNATITITDSAGSSTQFAVSATVVNVGPVPDRGQVMRAPAGTAVALNGSFFDPGPADTFTYSWIVRDSLNQIVATASTQDVSFTPDTVGTYSAAFQVTDADGATGSTSYSIIATDPNAPPDTTLPAAPTGLATSSVSPDGVTLTWSYGSDEHDGFVIEWSDDGTNFYAIDVVGPDERGYTDPWPVLNVEDYYRVGAYRGENDSLPVSPVSAEPITEPIPFYDDNAGANDRDTLSPYSVLHDEVLSGQNVFGNDIDIAQLAFRIYGYTQPQHGTVAVDDYGYFTYTPAAHWVGTDTFTYTVIDPSGRVSQPAIAAVDVTDQAPAVDDQTMWYTQNDPNFPPPCPGAFNAPDVSVPLPSGSQIWHNVLHASITASDSDRHSPSGNGDVVTYRVTGQPKTGTVYVDSATGQFWYTPNSKFVGFDQFQVVANDGVTDSAPGTIRIQDDFTTPYASHNDDLWVHVNDGAGYFAGTANPQWLVIIKGPEHGYFTYDANGLIISYRPNSDWTGNDTITWAWKSGNLMSKPSVSTMHVTSLSYGDWVQQQTMGGCGQPFPIGVSDTQKTFKTSDQSGLLGAAALGVKVHQVGNVAHGTLQIEPDGSLAYTPEGNSDFRGWVYFAYQYTGSTTNTGVNWSVLDVGYTPPISHTEAQVRPETFPATLKGIWDAYIKAKDALIVVINDMADFGHAEKDLANCSDSDRESKSNTADLRKMTTTKDYGIYLQKLNNALNAAADFMKSHWLATQARKDALDAIMSLPRDVANIKPNEEQNRKLAEALRNYAAGATAFQVTNDTIVTIAKETHDALEQILRYGGLAAMGISAAEMIAQGGSEAVIQLSLQAIQNLAKAQIANYCAQNALAIAQKFGININPDYLRIAADAWQVYGLFCAARAQNKAALARCFVAGTQVLTGSPESPGRMSQKGIDQIKVNDLVWAKNESNPAAQPELQRVRQVFVHTAYDLQTLSVRDAEGQIDVIHVTDTHPFYVDGGGWTDAAHLSVGDALTSAEGTDLIVIANEDEKHPEGVLVYNFEVEGDHTYFVSAAGGSEDFVWVHNACYSGQNPDLNAPQYRGQRHGDSDILRSNLKRAGVNDPAPGQSSAHHIVPGKAGPNAARDILDNAGININEAANGVYLPRNGSYTSPPTLNHPMSGAYYESVKTRLEIAVAGKTPGTAAYKDAVTGELSDIRGDLTNGHKFW